MCLLRIERRSIDEIFNMYKIKNNDFTNNIVVVVVVVNLFSYLTMRKRFCSIVCHYYTHVDCIPSAVADCKETATYHPGKLLDSVHHEHHWREGNLRPGAVCYACAKPCWTTVCLAGFRCEWCGITVSKMLKNLARFMGNFIAP